MEIKVGEYVRTKDGLIDKVQNYSYSQNIWHCENGMCIDECNCIGTHLEDILKHSFNIIDLIEEGDIVNGFTIEEFDDEDGNIYLGIPIYDDAQLDCIEEVRTIDSMQIKTILTHEQYERICYRLEEEKMQKEYKGYELLKAIAENKIDVGTKFKMEDDIVYFTGSNIVYNTDECIFIDLKDLAEKTFILLGEKIDIQGMSEYEFPAYIGELTPIENKLLELINVHTKAIKQLNRKIKGGNTNV